MCAHTKRNIFTVPTSVTDIVSHTATCAHYLSLIINVTNLHFATPSVIPQLVTPSVITPSVTPSALSFICPHSNCHSLLPPDTPSALSFICHHSSLTFTPHSTPSVVSSSPLICWFLVRCLSTHYFSSQSGMTWSSHINLIGKLEKRSCYKHSREDTNDFGAQTV